MSSEYFLNGVDLDQPGRWRVMQGTLLPAVAAPRLHSTEVPIRSGILDGAGERVGTFKVTVAFMVEGADRAGLDRNWQVRGVGYRHYGHLRGRGGRMEGCVARGGSAH